MRQPLDRFAIRAAFDRAGARFEEAAALHREVERRLLERVEYAPIAPGRVLDLGAGHGRAAAHLARRFPDAAVVATDLALGMLRRDAAREHVRVCADAGHLPFAADSFDLVVSNLMLQWMLDLPATFAELRRILRPKGLLLFSTFGPDTLRELRDAWSRVDEHVHVNAFPDMHHVGDALVQAGFDDPVMDMEALTVSYPTVRKLLHDLRALGATNQDRRRRRTLTAPARLAAMEAAYEASFGADGRVPATCEVVYGHALGPPPGRARRLDGMEEAAFPVDALRGSRRRR